jgi:hypothetical protein
METVSQRGSAASWVVATTAALVVLLVFAVFIGGWPSDGSSPGGVDQRGAATVTPTTMGPTEPPVESLTGCAVGAALGLESIATNDNSMPCDWFVEFVHGTGFCLDTLDLSGLEREVITAQIMGTPRTDTLVEYERVQRQIEELRAQNAPLSDLMPLIDKRDALQEQLDAEGATP